MALPNIATATTIIKHTFRAILSSLVLVLFWGDIERILHLFTVWGTRNDCATLTDVFAFYMNGTTSVQLRRWRWWRELIIDSPRSTQLVSAAAQVSTAAMRCDSVVVRPGHVNEYTLGLFVCRGLVVVVLAADLSVYDGVRTDLAVWLWHCCLADCGPNDMWCSLRWLGGQIKIIPPLIRVYLLHWREWWLPHDTSLLTTCIVHVLEQTFTSSSGRILLVVSMFWYLPKRWRRSRSNRRRRL